MLRIYNKPVLSVTGMEMIRGDWNKTARDLQEEVVIAILNEVPSNQVAEIVDSMKEKVLDNKLELSQIAIVQRIKNTIESYKQPVIDKKTGKQKFKKNGEPYKKAIPQHVKVAILMRDLGEEVVPGMRIEYVFDEVKGAVPLSQYSGVYDKETYWNKKIGPPTLRILRSAFPDKDWAKSYLYKKPKTKGNKQLSEWI